MGLLDNNIMNVLPKMVSGTLTRTFTSEDKSNTFENIANPNKAKTLIVNVNIENDTTFFLYCSKNGQGITYSSTGRVYGPSDKTMKSGWYYIELNPASTFNLRVETNAEQSSLATINYILCDVEPIFNRATPIAKLCSTKYTVASSGDTGDVTSIFRQAITGYKFYFVTVDVENNNASVNRQFIIKSLFEDYYQDRVELISTDLEEVLSVPSNYRGHSEWKQCYGNNISICLNAHDAVAGDTYRINLYGVR